MSRDHRPAVAAVLDGLPAADGLPESHVCRPGRVPGALAGQDRQTDPGCAGPALDFQGPARKGKRADRLPDPAAQGVPYLALRYVDQPADYISSK